MWISVLKTMKMMTYIVMALMIIGKKSVLPVFLLALLIKHCYPNILDRWIHLLDRWMSNIQYVIVVHV